VSIIFSGYEITKRNIFKADDFKFPDPNSTNKEPIKLSDDKKKQMFLDYFNKILNLFF